LILSYLDSLKNISPEGTKAIANKYVNGDNMIRFILLPQN